MLSFCDRQKFNLTGEFFIFLFMVTSRGIFICSAARSSHIFFKRVATVLFSTHLKAIITEHLDNKSVELKGCVHYIFASLFCMSKRKHFWNKEKSFLFHFKSSFCSWDIQILTFQSFKCHDIIKCLNVKHKTHIVE